jgi:lysine 2,3-aminomutase
MKVKYITNLQKVEQLTSEEVATLNPVTDKFAFRTNDYYNSLINWDDPDDPIKRLIIPVKQELSDWGQLDASDEKSYQPVPGVEHKYANTVLLLCNDVCAAYCRFCFRKRLFQNDNDEVVKDVSKGIEYIKSHKEVNNVLLTGGDPLVMSTAKLMAIIEQLCTIDHVKNIRIGTKVPAFNPYRILNDPTLPEMFKYYSTMKQIYIMAHYNHPRELTEASVKSLKILSDAGAAIVNQTPIIRKVNDSGQVLSELFQQLSFYGIQSYYVFACRPTEGNETFAVPIEEAFGLFQQAINNTSGLAKTARFIMSHKSGKIEIVGLTDQLIIMKNHNVVNSIDNGELVICKRNPNAYWFEDYEPIQINL